MTDRYAGMSPDLLSPYVGGALITKSDTTVIETTRAIWVGGVGDMKVTMQDGSVVVFTAIAAGTLLPIRVTIVWSAGTSATLMYALY
jgi:hypothetical protein